MNVRRIAPLLNHRAKRDTTIFNSPFSMKEKQQVQLNLLFFFTLPDFRQRHNQFPRPAGRYSSTR